MAHFYRLLISSYLLCFSGVALGQSAPVGSIDLAGWIKGTDGSYSRAYPDNPGSRTTPTNTTVNSASTALVQTSKGAQSFEIARSAAVDVSRVGKAVRGLAILGGPLGMTITAVSLVCQLTTICNVDGQWMTQAPPNQQQTSDYYASQVGQWCNGAAPCFSGVDLKGAIQLYMHPPAGFYLSDIQWIPSPNALTANNILVRTATGGYPYAPVAFTLMRHVDAPPANSHPTTASDWDSKQSLLNDARFTPELNEKGADIPTGIPTLQGNPKKVISESTEPTKDQNGNVTGSRKTTTEAEIVDAATSDAPSRVIVKETTTVNNYDINNTLINTTTTTNYTNQPEKQNIEIKFDEVPPATLPTYTVPNTFTSTSWGSGTCPPDIEVVTSNITFSIPTQPVCDTAEMINPFVLLLASLIGVYIVSGVRGGNAT